jgi:hypothetical protein
VKALGLAVHRLFDYRLRRAGASCNPMQAGGLSPATNMDGPRPDVMD